MVFIYVQYYEKLLVLCKGESQNIPAHLLKQHNQTNIDMLGQDTEPEWDDIRTAMQDRSVWRTS